MQTGWVRLSRTCNNACLFCADAEALDGSIVPADAAKAAIDAVAEAGAARVVLSGGEPTLSKHLLTAIKHAKARGLTVALTTNGRILQSEKVARMLEAAGLDELHVSIHSGRRTTHDQLVGRDNAWVESLAAMRYGGRTGMRVVVRAVMTEPNRSELAYLMHLAMMGGAKGMELRFLQDEGAAPAHREALSLPPRTALGVVAELWYEAKEEQIDLTVHGLDGSLDLGLQGEGRVRQADRAALRLLRQRVALFQASRGFSLLGDEDSAKDVVQLAGDEGGLAQVGHELAARGAPFVDAPWCIGGRPDDPARWGDEAHFAEACGACPVRDRCPGLPPRLKRLDQGQLAPLPAWRGAAGAAVVCGGGDDLLLTGHVLPALAEALAAEGLDARWSPEPADADLVVCGDAATAARALAARREGQRVVVLDGALGLGLDALPAAPDLVEACAPARVDVLRAAGLDLRRVRFRPFPVPPACADARPPTDGPIVALGETADWSLLESALVHATGKLPPVHAFCPPGAPDSGVWTRHEDAGDAAMLAAVLEARVVVLASGRPADTPEGRRAWARDLRWLSVAAAAGRPVVAVRAPGVDDHVRHDRTGWLCPATGPAALSEGLRRVCGDPARHARYAAEARALGAQALPSAWARDLVRGRLPDAVPLRPDALRPFPPW